MDKKPEIKPYVLTLTEVAGASGDFRVSIRKNGEKLFNPMYFGGTSVQNVIELVEVLVGGYDYLDVDNFLVEKGKI